MEVKEDFETIPNQSQDKVDNGSKQIHFCRICFQNDNESYVKPCRCTGNSEFVHDKCLSSWVLTKLPNIDGVKCEICLEKFEFITKRKCFFTKNISPLNEYKKYRNIMIFCIIALALSIIILVSLKVHFTKVNKKKTGNLVVGIICGVPVLLSVYYIQLSFRKLFFAYETTLIFKPFPKKFNSMCNSKDLSMMNS